MDAGQGVTQGLRKYGLMHRVGVAVEQAHAYCLDIELLESTDDAPHAVHVELRDDLTLCANPLIELDATTSGNQRPVSTHKSVGVGTITPAKLQHISKSDGGDESHLRALALEDGVGRHSSAVHYNRKLPHRLHGLMEPSQKAVRLVASGKHFRRPCRSGFGVVHNEVGESATDVDASNETHGVRFCISGPSDGGHSSAGLHTAL